MDFSRLSLWDRIVGVAGALLSLSLFLSWWSVEQVTELGDSEKLTVTGWQALGGIDVLIFVAGLGVVALTLAKAAGRRVNLPVAPAAAIGALGLFAVILAFFRLVDAPEPFGSVEAGESFGVPGVFELSTGASQSELMPEGIYAALILGALIAVGAWKLLRAQGTSPREQVGLLAERLRGQGSQRAGGATPATEPPPPPPPPPPSGPSADMPPPPPPVLADDAAAGEGGSPAGKGEERSDGPPSGSSAASATEKPRAVPVAVGVVVAAVIGLAVWQNFIRDEGTGTSATAAESDDPGFFDLSPEESDSLFGEEDVEEDEFGSGYEDGEEGGETDEGTQPEAGSGAAAPGGSDATPAGEIDPTKARAEVRAALEDYADAYSAQDVAQLRRLFASGVVRHGLREGGCSNTVGIDDVLETYEEQFALGPGSYALTDLSDGTIVLDGASASVSTGYTISAGARGSITFELERPGSRWLITRVDASC